MRIIGCDLHASQQTIAMLDCETGEVVERTLTHEGTTVRDFYAGLPPPIVVGIEATGSMGWFLRLMEELGVTYWVGDPAKIRKVETRRQKHDRRDAALLLELLTENRFPSIWMPSSELCDLRALLVHRDQWVRMRTRVKNALQGLALAHGVAGAPDCGLEVARRRWPRYHLARTLAIGDRNCNCLTTTSPSTSTTSINKSVSKRTSVRRPAAS
jgi:transposase